MNDVHSPNIPYDLEYSPNGIGVVDGVGYINMFFTQNNKHPEQVTIELHDGTKVSGSYDGTTGHYVGTFLPSYGEDKVYRIKGKAITDKDVVAEIDYNQSINSIPGMSLEVYNVHVTDDSILMAELKLNVDPTIRKPVRVYPSLVSVFGKGALKRVSTVSWDAKTNKGHVGFKLCTDCTVESLRVVQSTLEVDDKLIDFSIQYLTPAVNIELKTISVENGVATINYKFNGGNSQIPFTAEIVNVKVFENARHPKLIESVESVYSHRYGTLSVKVPVTTPTTSKIDHEITGIFKIDGGIVSRTLNEKITSYLKADDVDPRVIEHYITENGKHEVAKLKSTLSNGKYPVRLVVDGVTGFDKRKLVKSNYDVKTGVLTMVWEVNSDISVKTTFDLNVVVSYPDYGTLRTKFTSLVTPNYYLFPPKVSFIESGVTQKEGRLYMNVRYDVRYADGSIPSSMVCKRGLRNATFSDIRKSSEVSNGYDNKTGVATLSYPIKELRYIDGNVGVSVDLTFPLQNKNVYPFRFGSMLRLPLAPQLLNKKVTVDKENNKLTISFNALEADGKVPENATVNFPFEIATGVKQESATGSTFSIEDGGVEITFETDVSVVDHKFKTTVIVGNNIKPVVLEI